MSELKGKVLSEVIAEGMGKLASMPSGKGTQRGTLISRYFFNNGVGNLKITTNHFITIRLDGDLLPANI